MTASSEARRGRPSKPPRQCESDQCENSGRYNIVDKDEKFFVCSTCKSRHDRQSKNICDVRGCSGVVRFGKNRERRYCRSHEGHYQTDNIAELTSTLDYLGQAIRDRGNGCWEYVGRDNRDEGTDRPQVWCDGLRWYVTRFLYVYFYGTHKGRLELHHLCGRGDCVRPGHLMALTRKRNAEVEGRKFFGLRRYTLHKMFQKERTPKDPAKAVELAEFTTGIPLAPNQFGVRYGSTPSAGRDT